MGQDQAYLYQEFAPGRLLDAYVQCFWILKSPARLSQGLERAPADGHVNIMFHLATPFTFFPADGRGESQVQRRSALLGGRSRGYLVEQQGDAHYVTIRFRPGGLAAFLRSPMSELVDQSVEIDLLWGSAVKRLEEQLFEAATPQQMILILTRALLSRFQQRPHLDAMLAAVRSMEAVGGNVSIPVLAKQLGWSQRHFERLFAEYVGFAPKYYARISRFERLSSWVTHQERLPTFGQLAADFGYYDQAHFVKEVTHLSGVPPRMFFATPDRVAQNLAADSQLISFTPVGASASLNNRPR